MKTDVHQRSFTQQFAPSNQVSDGDVEVGVPAAPVGDLGERMCDEDVLQRERQHCHTPIVGLLTVVVTSCCVLLRSIARSLNQKSALAQLNLKNEFGCLLSWERKARQGSTEKRKSENGIFLSSESNWTQH